MQRALRGGDSAGFRGAAGTAHEDGSTCFINIVNINIVKYHPPLGIERMKNPIRLGEFEQLALLAVLQLGNEAYGGSVLEVLEERAAREASVSAVYITLTRLEEKGLVESWMGDPTEERGGKAKRFFRVTAEGVDVLQHSRSQLLRMWEGLEGLLGAESAAG